MEGEILEDFGHVLDIDDILWTWLLNSSWGRSFMCLWPCLACLDQVY